MDLETIIPLVIVAVAYLFKAFENARKGDKKKRRPAPGRPPVRRERSVKRKPLVSSSSPDRSGLPEKPGSAGRQPLPEGEKGSHRPGNREVPEQPAVPDEELPSEGRWWWEEVLLPPSPASETKRASDPEQPAETGRVPAEASYDPGAPPGNAGLEKATSADNWRPPAEREDSESNEYADFDLKDAVIKSAILERREF